MQLQKSEKAAFGFFTILRQSINSRQKTSIQSRGESHGYSPYQQQQQQQQQQQTGAGMDVQVLLALLQFSSVYGLSSYRAMVVFLLLKMASRDLSVLGAYNEVGKSICCLQLFGFLEVVHATLGLVNSGLLLSLMQWAGRTHVLCFIIYRIEEVQRTPFVIMMIIAWSFSEVIRYPHYVLHMLGVCPAWLSWLRYTAFIPIYPVGVLGEVGAMYLALPFIKSDMYGNIFQLLPFGYSSFITVLFVIYPFLWMPLYIHMLKQRHKKLVLNSIQRKKTTMKDS